MIPKEQQAAQLLLGKVLQDGWKVIKKIEPGLHNTGGVYSCCYEVEKDGKKGFLKAFDYSTASKIGEDSSKQMGDILSAFNIERDILNKCFNANCTGVVELLTFGSIDISEASQYPRVEYLVLEYAERGDIRTVLRSDNLTLEWKIRSLHQLAKGLSQIHKLDIAHQDIKPSNIVLLTTTKLTDFGSAVNIYATPENLPFNLNKDFCGTWEYAPPELLYGHVDANPVVRRIGCDLYLLGSMIVFYFTTMNMTALIRRNLQDAFCWTNPNTRGNYNEIKPYLLKAFAVALKDLEGEIYDKTIRDNIILMVRFLCNPDPNSRGHLKDIGGKGSNYSLMRFVTMLDVMARKLAILRK